MSNTKTDFINSHRVIVILFDGTNTNPQGDPDNDNSPRIELSTNKGLVTAPGQKRKVRDQLAHMGHSIYVSRGQCFELANEEIARSLGLTDINLSETSEAADESEEEEVSSVPAKKAGKGNTTPAKSKNKMSVSAKDAGSIRDSILSRYPDVRLFGHTFTNLPTTRGPIQFEMAETIDRVEPVRHVITRVAVQTRQEAEKKDRLQTMGEYHCLPYGLFRSRIFVNPSDARSTKCTEADYEVFLKALVHMFDNDRSAGRSLTMRAIYEFRLNPKASHHLLEGDHHPVNIGRLSEAIRVRKRSGISDPRAFEDYQIDIHPSVYRHPEYTFSTILDPRSIWETDKQAAE